MGTELAQSIKKTENGQPEAATEGRTGTRQTETGATGWKAEVKAELKAHRGHLIVCALIGILLLAFLISHKSVFEEPWGTNINLAADYGTIPLQEGHELSQSFRSEGQHLDQLFLWIEGAASADGTLEDGITVVFDYERMNIRAFARAIFLVLVLVGLLAVPASFIQGILRKIGVGGHGACGTLTEPFLVEENRQKLSMLASAAVLFLGPVFTYWLVEYAGGNWENVSKSYGLYNILWYFLFYAAIYVVTDRASMDGTSTAKTVPQNIIMIMNESLTDYSVFNNFAPSEDVLTFIHSLQENTIKGYLQTPVFGGGTCNTEYESLTGNSLTFLPGGVMPYQMYVTPDTISLNKILQGQGYTGYAMHPFPASNWNREEAFQDMGFAQFLSEPDFAGEEMIRDMCSDAGDYDRMIKLYEEKKGSPLFFFNVTLQNHGGYTDGEYEATIHVPTSGRPAGGAYPQAEQYLSLAHASDQAFEQLVNYFSQVEEPTMIVMYGDHQPKLEDGFYEYLTGKPASEWTQEETMQLYETPYVIWTNYPLDTTTQVPKRLSANYLSSWMLKLAGVQLPEYNRYLLQLCRDVPVVTPKGCLDARGNYFRAEDAGRYAPLLQEYVYLQYNNLFDADHRLQSFWGEETP